MLVIYFLHLIKFPFTVLQWKKVLQQQELRITEGRLPLLIRQQEEKIEVSIYLPILF